MLKQLLRWKFESKYTPFLAAVIIVLTGCDTSQKQSSQPGERSLFLESVSASARGEPDDYIRELQREANKIKK